MIVSWLPESDLSLPLSIVTVSKPVPALFGTTNCPCTGGPPSLRMPLRMLNMNGCRPAAREDPLFDGAAAVPAIPAITPAVAQTAAAPAAVIRVLFLNTMLLLALRRLCSGRIARVPKKAVWLA